MHCWLKHSLVDLPDVPHVSSGYSSSPFTSASLGLKISFIPTYRTTATSRNTTSSTWMCFTSPVLHRGRPSPCAPSLLGWRPSPPFACSHSPVLLEWRLLVGSKCWRATSERQQIKLRRSGCPHSTATGRTWGCKCMNGVRLLQSETVNICKAVGELMLLVFWP